MDDDDDVQLCENSFVFNEELIGRWLQGLTTKLWWAKFLLWFYGAGQNAAAAAAFLFCSIIIEDSFYNAQVTITVIYFTVTSFIFSVEFAVCGSVTLQRRPKISMARVEPIFIYWDWIEEPSECHIEQEIPLHCTGLYP